MNVSSDVFRRSDEELKVFFRSLRDGRDIADLLEVTYPSLTFHIYRSPIESRYRTFEISKRSGGKRVIHSPQTNIILLQKKLNHILQLVYTPKLCVQGFVERKNILTNAQAHLGSRCVLNLDLEDFFGSINFGRVRGMLLSKPYSLSEKAATVLAQIVCHDNRLPQGAPTSPTVSNMICGRLDSDLLRLAAKYNCKYTRYADDITFSSTSQNLPKAIAQLDEDHSAVIIGAQLEHTIQRNGFRINETKTRLQRKGRRQEVTGLVINDFPNIERRYIRRLRAMIHAIHRFGEDKANCEFHEKYYRRDRRSSRNPSIRDVLCGRIRYVRFVKGESDPVYRNLWNQYCIACGRPIKYLISPFREIGHFLWVLENESEGALNQGTAFNLSGVGLVTCDHVLRDGMKALRAMEPARQFDIQIVKRNGELDLAVLRSPVDEISALELGDPESVRSGDKIYIAGFPNYRLGDSPQVREGTVSGFRMMSGIRRMLVSAPIVAGNSGGPALDSMGRVIGVAATGTDRIENADKTEDHGVIPISAICKF